MDPVAAAFAATPREWFLPSTVRDRSTYDGPLQIGHGQTNSQPRTVEDMLRLLNVRRGDHVLDVGSGSGWTTALLARLTGRQGRVQGVERLGDLVVAGAANLERTDQPWATIEAATEGVLGLPQEAPFDRVLVSAGARRLPESLVAQLDRGGVMVIPVDSVMLRVACSANGHITITDHGRYSFVPLID